MLIHPRLSDIFLLYTPRVLVDHIAVSRPSIARRMNVRVEEELFLVGVVHDFDDNGLAFPRVDHHVPGVTVEPLRPIVVTLGNLRIDSEFMNVIK